jgi:hypothetical protein
MLSMSQIEHSYTQTNTNRVIKDKPVSSPTSSLSTRDSTSFISLALYTSHINRPCNPFICVVSSKPYHKQLLKPQLYINLDSSMSVIPVHNRTALAHNIKRHARRSLDIKLEPTITILNHKPIPDIRLTSIELKRLYE